MIGLAGSAAPGRIVSGFLYQVTPLDPWTYAATAVTLILTRMAAALVRRIEPLHWSV